MLNELHNTFKKESTKWLDKLKVAAIQNENVFEALMEATKYASIGQITNSLFGVGGQYRRNM